MPGLEYTGTITLSSVVADLDTSITWFKDKLGFEEIFRAPEAGWAEVTSPVGDVTIGLAQSGDIGSGGNTVPVLGVNNVDAARADLEAKGVQFAGDNQVIPGMVKLATFHDPDGNAYMLAEDLSGN